MQVTALHDQVVAVNTQSADKLISVIHTLLTMEAKGPCIGRCDWGMCSAMQCGALCLWLLSCWHRCTLQ